VNRADWHAVAALCDPASLIAFRRQQLERIVPTTASPALTVETFLRHQPDMPRAVAEYQVEQYRRNSAALTQRLLESMPGVASANDLRALSPAAAFAAWLEGRSPRRQIERLAADGHILAATAALLGDMSDLHHHVPLGVVFDGARVAHVAYHVEGDAEDDPTDEAAEWLARLTVEERDLARDLSGRERPQMETCRRQPDGTWRLLARDDFLSLGSIGYSVDSVAPEDAPAAPRDVGHGLTG